MTEAANDVALWVAQARNGSTEAMGHALQACRGYLLEIARDELDPELQAKGGASDLVQETFLEAQRDFGHFHGQTEAELLAWLRQVLLNNVANFARSFRETRKRQIGREVALEGKQLSRPLRWELVSHEPSPSEQAIAHEQAERLHKALAKLSEAHRQILLLRFQDELSFEEISQRIGHTANAVGKRFARAIERLQAELEILP